MGREPLLGSARTTDALLLHQTGDLVATNVEVGTPGGLREFAAPVHRVVLLPDRLDLGAEFGVADLAGARRAALGGPVGGGGDLQHRADRLDSPSQPTGPVGPVGVDERDNLSDLNRGQRLRYLLGRPSSSVAKKTDAAFKISFARRSSFTSRSS